LHTPYYHICTPWFFDLLTRIFWRVVETTWKQRNGLDTIFDSIFLNCWAQLLQSRWWAKKSFHLIVTIMHFFWHSLHLRVPWREHSSVALLFLIVYDYFILTKFCSTHVITTASNVVSQLHNFVGTKLSHLLFYSDFLTYKTYFALLTLLKFTLLNFTLHSIVSFVFGESIIIKSVTRLC
jgi:hypothetical protein